MICLLFTMDIKTTEGRSSEVKGMPRRLTGLNDEKAGFDSLYVLTRELTKEE